jgi:hypothetical protein
MLPARIGIGVGDERAQHRTIDGPRPGGGAPGMHERGHQDRSRKERSVANSENHEGKSIEPVGCCQI